ncbi:efflux RND transporter periplasmic adaptor subunit [Methyloceanibacter caenitepidi]|uniref:Probable RND efflux membrane fusion protein n=1 Tax=Methyloceanibacter caenitepidi TaxID=1384459 RepID=A0A0A8K1I9_9HYPH|nr:efflux RND transporter periplasmic adaptor subunit [Methyloceanibacter caenitepidi]BAQ16676.1 probable RND efflux membrane fusion protein [Methyloceanibacter caenitepidi]
MSQICVAARCYVTAILVLAAIAIPAAAADQSTDREAVRVEVAKVVAGPLNEQVTAVGTLLSDEAVTISSEISGRLEAIHFEEGQPVKESAPLFSLDDSVYKAQLADAEAKAKLAEQTYQRTSKLFSSKYATAQSADEASSNVAVTGAAVELARVQLEKTRITAPFSGIIGLRHVSVGEYITAGQALVNLEAIDPVKADFRVPERFLPAIKVGQSIRIRVDAFPDETFDGEISAIDPRIDVSGRSLMVRAKVPNSQQRLRPGLFARVTVLLQIKEDALTIPEQAIVPQGDDQFVYKVQDGRATLTKVSVGMRRSGHVEILEGLKEGDQVVTAGQIKLHDGSPVSAVTGTGA